MKTLVLAASLALANVGAMVCRVRSKSCFGGSSPTQSEVGAIAPAAVPGLRGGHGNCQRQQVVPLCMEGRSGAGGHFAI
jgi:hypothetical protein